MIVRWDQYDQFLESNICSALGENVLRILEWSHSLRGWSTHFPWNENLSFQLGIEFCDRCYQIIYSVDSFVFKCSATKTQNSEDVDVLIQERVSLRSHRLVANHSAILCRVFLFYFVELIITMAGSTICFAFSSRGKGPSCGLFRWVSVKI